MSNFKSLICEIVDAYLKNIRPLNILIGNIRSVQPLEINISSEKFLPVQFFEFSSKVSYLKDTKNENLIGDKLIICQLIGGQKYIVLDKFEDLSNGASISTIENISPLKIKLANGKILEEFIKLSKSLEFLKTTTDTSWIGKSIITLKEIGSDDYIFLGEIEV